MNLITVCLSRPCTLGTHTNPSPYVLPNGTIVMAFNAGFCHNHLETIGLAVSHSGWQGPWCVIVDMHDPVPFVSAYTPTTRDQHQSCYVPAVFTSTYLDLPSHAGIDALTDYLVTYVLVFFISNRDMPSHICIVLHWIFGNKQESSRAKLNPQEC